MCFFIIFEFDFDFAASAFVALVSCASAVAVFLCLLLTVAAVADDDDALWILNFAHSSLKAQRFGVVRTFGAAMLEYLARYKIKLFARFF